MKFPRLTLFRKSTEGSYRGPAVGLSHWGNAFPVPFGDGFQSGLALQGYGADGRFVPISFACVTRNAGAVSVCPAQHMVKVEGDQMVASTTSPASRLLRYPNSYETFTQFIYNVVCQLLFEGEAFAVIARDDRFAPNALHLMPRNSCSPYVDPTTGEIFYSIGANPMAPQGISMIAPARDVIHFRQYCPRHPLIGESAIRAAALALGVNVALAGNQATFFSQMNRPSGVLSTDTVLTRAQIQELRKAFDEQAAGMNAGKVPILGGGLKFSQMSISSQDAQLIEAQRMSIEDVARVYGVPLPLIGDPTSGGVANTESLITFWLSTALGSLLTNLENSLARAFALPQGETINFDETALLRTDLKSRVEAFTQGVQGGIYTPNEVRARESLPAKEGGDALFLQRQMVPVDIIDDLARAELAAAAAPSTPAATPAMEPEEAPEEEEPEDDGADDSEDEPTVDAEVTSALVYDLIRRKSA